MNGLDDDDGNGDDGDDGGDDSDDDDDGDDGVDDDCNVLMKRFPIFFTRSSVQRNTILFP